MSFKPALYDPPYHSDITPPTVVRITGETTVLENSYVTYQCSADGYPETKKMYVYNEYNMHCLHIHCRWTADCEEHSGLPQTATDNGNGQLRLQVTQADTSCRYCCEASNGHGHIISECFKINVLSK